LRGLGMCAYMFVSAHLGVCLAVLLCT